MPGAASHSLLFSADSKATVWQARLAVFNAVPDLLAAYDKPVVVTVDLDSGDVQVVQRLQFIGTWPA